MPQNLGYLPKEERDKLEAEKKQAHERYLLKKAGQANLEMRAESEYQRLLWGRECTSISGGSGRGWS